MRTSGISGLATEQLAAPAANIMALIGTGAQALAQVAAVAATLSLRELRVFSPTQEKCAAFVARAREAFAMEVVDAPSLAVALADAPIVTLDTRAGACSRFRAPRSRCACERRGAIQPRNTTQGCRYAAEVAAQCQRLLLPQP